MKSLNIEELRNIVKLYDHESSDPKWNAQQNLDGRTHYVDDDTLKYHKSRINLSVHTDQGLLFAIVESYQVGPDSSLGHV